MMVKVMSELGHVYKTVRNDNRVGPIHMSLLMAIIYYWQKNDCNNPVCVFSRELMELSKITGVSTYYKMIRELHEYGYIKYEPSKNHFAGSLIFFNINKGFGS